MSLIQQISAFINDAITSTTTVWSSQKIANELAAITGGVSFQGGYDVATNTPDLVTPVSGAVDKGFMYIATTGGTFFGETLEVGDVLIAKVDDPSALTDWVLIQGNQMIQSLQSVLSVGNTSGAFDIVMDDTQKVQLGSNANQFLHNIDVNTVNLSVQRLLEIIIVNTSVNSKWSFDDSSFVGDSDDYSMIYNFPDGTIQFTDKGTGYVVTLQFNDTLTGSATISLPLTSGRLALESQLPVSASTTVQGIIEIATGLEIDGGTDNTRAISPFGLANSTLASNVATNNAKVTNATHMGDVTGATALTIANNAVTNAKAADMAAYTLKLRNNAASGDPEDVKISALTEETAPTTGDFLLMEESGGALRKVNWGEIQNPTPTVIAPAQITTDVNDYNPTGWGTANIVRVDLSANFDCTGLQAGSDWEQKILINTTTGQTLKLKHNDALSLAGNRIFCPDGVDFNLHEFDTIKIIYDPLSLKWRVVGAKN